MVRFARFLVPVLLAATPAAAQFAEAPLPDSAPEAMDAMPRPPAVVAASFATPARDAAGRYLTPNRDLTADEAVWHLRVALNVAALGCRDRDEAATVAAYNGLLASARDQLAGAQTAVAAVYRVRYGAAAQARNDDAMTRLYNFFAQPTGHDAFCAAAKSVLAEAATVEPGALASFAAAALPRLEAPFTAFFAAWDSYRAALAQWQGRHAAATELAAATSVPAPVLAAAVAAPVVVAAASAPAPLPAPTAAPAPVLVAATAPAPLPAPVLVAASAPSTGAAPQPVTITRTPEALQAIVAGQVPGVTIAGAVATTPPAPPAVVLASVR